MMDLKKRSIGNTRTLQKKDRQHKETKVDFLDYLLQFRCKAYQFLKPNEEGFNWEFYE